MYVVNTMARSVSIRMAMALLATLGACSGSEDKTPAVTEVQVSLSALQLAKGTSATITVTAVLDDATRRDCTAAARIVSSDPAVLSVQSGKVLLAAAPGVVTVTATCEGVSGSQRVEVTAAALREIQLAPTSLDLAAGTFANLAATGLFTDDTHQDLTSQVTWSSGDPAVASVNGGKVLAAAPGSTSIAAAKGDMTASADVRVTAAVLSSLAVRPEAAALPAGLGQALVLTGTFSDGTHQDLSASASWSSSDAGVIAMTSPGQVRAVAPGHATVTAASGALSATVAFTVTAAVPVSLQIDPPVIFLPCGESVVLSARVTLSDGTERDATADAAWSTSDPSVATPDVGRITSLSTGVAVITATLGEASGRTDVTVTAAQLTGLEILPAGPVELAVGLGTRLSARGTYTDHATLDLTDRVTWTVANAAVATVSNARASAGKVQALAEGTTRITVRMSGVVATTDVSVTPAILQSLSLTVRDTTVPVGLTLPARLTARFSDGRFDDVTEAASWTSLDQAVATVNAAGELLGVSQGSVVLQAEYRGLTDDVRIAVTAPVVVKLLVMAPSDVLPMWRSIRPSVVGTYSDGSKNDVTAEMSWSSSDDSIASFSWDGWLIGQNEGDVVITATSADGGVAGKLGITVLPSSASSLSISVDAPSLEVGAATRFQATATYDDGSTADVTYWTWWSSDDESVLRFLPDFPGQAEAVAEGTTTVHAGLDGADAAMEITVVGAPGD